MSKYFGGYSREWSMGSKYQIPRSIMFCLLFLRYTIHANQLISAAHLAPRRLTILANPSCVSDLFFDSLLRDSAAMRDIHVGYS